MQVVQCRALASLPFVIDLDKRQLEAVEDVRRGGGLTFKIRLTALAHFPGSTRVMEQDLAYGVNQGTWVEALNAMGYTRTILLEIPIPNANELPQMAQAARFLSQAQQQMALGKNREAVGLCRDSLEELSTALGDGDNVDPLFQSLLTGSSGWDKAKRIQLIRRATKILTHPARHAGPSSAAMTWERIDAQSVISLVSALIQVAGR